MWEISEPLLLESKKIAEEMLKCNQIIRSVPFGEAEGTLFVTTDPKLIRGTDEFILGKIKFFIGSGKSGIHINTDDPYDLVRYTKAQEGVYDQALSELRSGQKRTHWMWYIFPQLEGLGHSTTARRYAIKSIQETREYLNHPVLVARLLECTETVLDIEDRSVSAIFGFPDDVKLRSSMTLFDSVSARDSVFGLVLDKFFGGHRDNKTLQLLQTMR
jgi:uncharacterized protein (DUF1810 family)